jgi:spore coat polysaccharide biosynthesis protein SpsF
VLEWGANKGHNLAAIDFLENPTFLHGAEINKAALVELSVVADSVFERSVTEVHEPGVLMGYDLVVSRGLLIHIAPLDIEAACRNIYASSEKYILLAEYYSPFRREVPYRGHTEKLWAFDFIGEFMKATWNRAKVIDYGYFWKGDTKYGQDDITWFLLEREHAED